MSNRMILLVAALIALALVGPARADNIYLANGRTLKGRVTTQVGGTATVVLNNGGRLTMPASQIESVEPEQEKLLPPAPPPPPPPPPPDKTEPGKTPEKPVTPEGATEPAAEPAEPAEGGPEAPAKAAPEKGAEKIPDEAEIKKKAAELAPKIDALLDLMGTEGESNSPLRTSSRAALVKIGDPAVEKLAAALADQVAVRRENASLALAEIGSKRVARPLLAMLQQATPRTGAIDARLAPFLGDLAAGFNKATKQSFDYPVTDAAAAQQALGRMLAWWSKNGKDFLPKATPAPAEGEPAEAAEPEAAGPDPAEEIRKLPPIELYPPPPPR